jgi:signal transduction histidine kinase
VEDVDAARRRDGIGNANPSASTLAAELLSRVNALRAPARGAAPLPEDVQRRLDECETRARRGCEDFSQGAVLDFLGEAVVVMCIDDRFQLGEARAAVVDAAEEIGLSPETAAFAVFRRAVASRECIQLPPALAADLILALLVELAPAAASSLWTIDPGSATTCLASTGKAPQSRRLREVARAALDGVLASTAQVRVEVVGRWDRPYAALVARGSGTHSSDLDDYLAEAASVLGPLLERVALFERNAERERDLVAAGERRLVRVGFDLHDGPLQEIVALAEELRLARSQVEAIVGDDDRSHVRGRFQDLEARLGALDEGLRQIAHSVRSTTAVVRPVEDAVRRELAALERAAGIQTELRVEGNLDDLTDSQKIVVFRVVQEALSNVRKHSGAANVAVALRSQRTFLEVTVRDDGCGFDRRHTAGRDRLGLAGVSERVRLLGGAVEIDSRPGAGTAVRVTLPQWRPLSKAVRAAVYAVGS